MNLSDILREDVNNVFMSDLGKDVTYRRGDIIVEVTALILEDDLDVQRELGVEAVTYIYVGEQELIDKGLGQPSPHDIIDDKWEVGERKKVGSMWKLECYNTIRPRP